MNRLKDVARGLAAVVLGVLAVSTTPARAGDWPTYGADGQRSGTTREKLAFPLHKAWEYVPAQAPRPAWPEPGKELHRMDFDYAPQPVVAGGLVFIGSSADDTLRALDAVTGAVRWRFTTGGPVRFAPAIADGRVYLASDDGYLYCLAAASGKLLWRFHAAPRDDKLLGNGRMISRWPLRAGVLVTDGVVYTAAGMWPSEGIYLYALKADTGKVIWCNDSSGSMYMSTPHGGADAFTGVAPQGYLLVNKDVLIVPAGRSVPAIFDRHTGRLLFYDPATTVCFDGDSWATITGDLYLNPTHGRWTSVPPPHVGELDPTSVDGLGIYRASDGRRVGKKMPNKHRAVVADGILYATGGGQVHAVNMKAWLGSGDLEKSTKWTAPHARAYCVALAGEVLIVGGRGTVTALRLADGRQLWQAEVDGQVRGLAIADSRLVVTTHKGTVLTFGGGAAAGAPKRVVDATAWPDLGDAAEGVLERTGVREGYALVVGAVDGALAEDLARETKLHVIHLASDSKKAAAERARLLGLGPYGSRVVVDELPPSGRLPYAPYFADLVVVAGEVSGMSAKELYRTLRPYGGVLCFRNVKAAAARRLVTEAGIPAAEVRSTASGPMVVRGKLPGAGEWRYQWGNGGRTGIGNESRVRLPLEVLWFGGPGPDRMMDRHHGASPPLFVSGRVFVTGVNHLIAFNAYNGRELWSRQIEGVGRVSTTSVGANTCADDRYLYVAMGTRCHRIDQATGRTLQTYELPKDRLVHKKKQYWHYLAVAGDLVLGTSQYGRSLFALSKADGSLRWMYKATDTIEPTAVALGDGRAFLTDATWVNGIRAAERRGKTIKTRAALVAIELDSGKELWRQDKVPLTRQIVQYADGVVVVNARAGYDAATGRRLWHRPTWNVRPPVIHGNWVIAQPQAYDLRTGKPRMTTDILTGKERPWKFARAYGCNSIIGCQGLLLFRSGTEAFLDLDHDGTTNFGGVKPGCGQSTIPAGGLIIHAEGSSGCACSYNYQTSLALVPAKPRRDLWYVFQGEVSDGPVKHLSLNFGAPGDRQDSRGTRWLGYPRPVMEAACPAPVRVEMKKPDWYYQPTLAAVTGKTDRPWLYTSGLRGTGRLTIELQMHRAIVTPRVQAGPKVDGELNDACWQKATRIPFYRDAHLRTPLTKVLVCRDADNLYVAYERDAIIRKDGPVPFLAAHSKPGSDVWLDDSFEIQFTDGALRTYVQLGVSCAGGSVARRNTLVSGRWRWQGDPMKWEGRWSRAARKEERRWSGEVAVPVKTLAAAGLDVEALQLNVVSRNYSKSGWPLPYVTGFFARDFALPEGARPLVPLTEKPAQAAQRRMQVRLHFAEPDDVKPGERVFDVLLQGRRVLKGLDVVKEAGGPRRMLVKPFADITAGEQLTVELVPTKGDAAPPPVLCALEVLERE